MNRYRFKWVFILTTNSIVTLFIVQISWMSSIFSEMESQTKQQLERAMIGSMYNVSSDSENPIYSPSDLKFNVSENFVELKFAPAYSIFSAATAATESDGGVTVPFAYLLSQSVAVLDSLISYNLSIAGITQPYNLHLEYIEKISGDTLFMYDNNIVIQHYPPILQVIKLVFNLERTMKLNFNNEDYMFLTVATNVKYGQNLIGIIISTMLVILLVVFSFVYILRTLFRHKNLEEMRTDFTHNITHELKTPISVGVAAGEALLGYETLMNNPTMRKEYIEIMLEQYGNLSSMVNNILEMSVWENEKYIITPSRCDLNKIVGDIIEIYRFKSTKPFICRNEIPKDLTLFADGFHMNHIIGNLIDNSIKYSGDVVDITISAKVSSKNIVLRINDKGIGIPAKSLNHIFEKYYRVPNGDIQATNGQGIGLYYVKMAVEKHGGTVLAESTAGKGTSIILKFPKKWAKK